MKITAKLDTSKFQSALRKYHRSSGKFFRQGIREAAMLLRQDSRDAAPVDTGALRASGIWFITGKGWDSVAVVGFGAEVQGYIRVPSQYAVIQHDDPYNRKYLEYTLYALQDEISDILEASVSRSTAK